ncbi:MAG: AraC family transcriptional regulator [Lachnospiraceae bacterium]|nr:AraC family transcriptional regulator [Lachnospiraceae bacterium]
MRMREEYVYFPRPERETHFYIELSGITYQDTSYLIQRENPPILVAEYVLSGEGTIVLNGKQYHVKAGDLYLLPPGMDQLYYSDKENPWEKIWFNAQGTLVNSMLREYNPQKLVVFPGADGREYMERIQEIGRNDQYSAAEKHRKAALVFHELMQYLYDWSHMQDEMYGKETLLVKNYLDSHLTQNVPLKTLAEMVYLSESQVVRIFKRDVGKTPHEYSLDLKLEQARTLLRNTRQRVREISDSLGFCDEHYFSYIFKKKCGMTPLEYRSIGD